MYNLYLQVKSVLERELTGWHFNGAGEWLSVVVMFLAVFVLLRGGRKVVLYVCAKLENPEMLDGWDIVSDFVSQLNYFFSVSFAAYAATLVVRLPELLEIIFNRMFVVIMAVYLVLMLKRLLVDVFKVAGQIGKKDNVVDKTAVTFFRVVVSILLWAAAVVMVLQGWGFDVSVLLGGLGIVGIIVGLAFQSAMRDVLAFFSIYQDRTFKVGDYIVTPKVSGTVREINMRSTRLQAAKGHNVVISNQKLVDDMVSNYGRLKERTVFYSLKIDASVGLAKLENLSEIVKDMFENDEQVKGDAELKRAFIDEITDRGFTFEIVYTVRDADYGTYVQIKQRVNLALIKRFRQEKIKLDDTGQLEVVSSDAK
ncbi:mechanosensitive ion channel family protein [Microgenomates group bacterium]|nr:mechanosensitive ion channel family protein [Microgenomates group bacterium]